MTTENKPEAFTLARMNELKETLDVLLQEDTVINGWNMKGYSLDDGDAQIELEVNGCRSWLVIPLSTAKQLK